MGVSRDPRAIRIEIDSLVDHSLAAGDFMNSRSRLVA
jgi:hypothetical protein